jgi:AcrR family transcriptional regulator
VTQDNTKNEKIKQTQDKLIFKLLPTVRNGGFQTLRMDDIAKSMDISRATLYKYFPNKEDVFHKVTDGYVQYIEEMSTDYPKEKTQYATHFQQIYEQSVSLALLITDDFLRELQDTYPLMYEKLWEAILVREKHLLNFYNEGKQRGIFNEIDGRLLVLQDKMLFNILDLKYLMKNHWSIEQVLLDFYKLRKIQLFKPEMLSTLDDSKILPKVEHLTKKLSNMLL